jgi:hypothetical protein
MSARFQPTSQALRATMLSLVVMQIVVATERRGWC